MSTEGSSQSFLSRPAGQFVLALVVLLAALGLEFARSLDPKMALFSNDAPLGTIASVSASLPDSFAGAWQNSNWLGTAGGNSLPNLSYGMIAIFGPVGYAKFLAPVSHLLLGLSAWFFFRRCRFHLAVCVIGSLAVTLNMNVFSNSCWGLASRATMLASIFFALAMFPQPGDRWPIPRLILAGFGVGMGIMEGFDTGAIYSLYVAAFAVFISWIGPGQPLKKLVFGIGKTTVIALAAGVMAAAALVILIQTQVQGVVGMEQDSQAREERWDPATQWSLPKIEAARVIIPGLFGYRMDTPDGGAYWGRVGEQPGWEQHRQGFRRHSGAGEYAGVFVVLVAIWAAAQGLRRGGGPFVDRERLLIRFWLVAAILSLLFAFGRHAPFYRLIYALPYFSTIRNPIKFMHPFHLSLLILFGYGLQGIWRQFLERGSATPKSLSGALKKWWSSSTGFERKWNYGMVGAVALSALAWLVYSASRPDLFRHLEKAGFDTGSATEIAAFSIGEFGLFVLFLTLSAGLAACLFSGFFSGARARWAALAVGTLVVVDLYRANQPWIVYYDYRDMYASNPVIELLRDRAHERRVAVLPFRAEGDQFLGLFQSLYEVEWKQHLFQYYNVQTLDIIQEPREAVDNKAFRDALPRQTPATLVRLWELTNTRFLLGRTGSEQFLNDQIDPGRRRFRLHTAFDILPKPGRSIGPGIQLHDFTAEIKPQGQFGIIEFTGALPRARLYSQWEVSTNDQATLKRLPSAEFDPSQTVLVSDPISPSTATVSTNAGNVDFVSYAPKEIKLSTRAEAPTVLLLNDKFDPNWKVWVDGQPAPLLRCNFIMRGVALAPGSHTVEFRFLPSTPGLKISLAAIALGILLCGLLVLPGRTSPATGERGADSRKKA